MSSLSLLKLEIEMFEGCAFSQQIPSHAKKVRKQKHHLDCNVIWIEVFLSGYSKMYPHEKRVIFHV